MQYKLGKNPAKYDPKQIHLTDIESTVNPVIAPVGFDSTSTIGSLTYDWKMLGNDQFGDCVWAGADHETEVLLHDGTGSIGNFGDGSTTALKDYAACTGFNPNDPNSDRGTDMSVAMSYRRKTGIVDALGKRHKVGAYVALEPGNWNQLLEALYAFRVVGIGIEFPQSAMDQFNANKPWTVVKGSSIEGGHYIPVVGHPSLSYTYLITWGRKIKMSKAFYQKYNDETYAYVSVEDLKSNKSPAGYDYTTLNSILAEL